MEEKDPNLEWMGSIDLSSVSLQDESLDNVNIDDVLNNVDSPENTLNAESNISVDTNNNTGTSENADINADALSGIENISIDEAPTWNAIDQSVFLDSEENVSTRKNVLKDGDNFWSYLRWFFFSAILTLLWVLAIALFYSFSTYITEATKEVPDINYQDYIKSYKEKYKNVKEMVWIVPIHESPKVWNVKETEKVNEIINATDIDYIEKKDLLSQYVSDLVRNAENWAVKVETLKEEIAKQWFLPEELETLISNDQAIDTIQRSLNALEVIKFSTATKVFSFMNSALNTISEMIKISWSSAENLKSLFDQINDRWERDISSYVYMCYLNPFETNADCDTIWDLDAYYSISKDKSVNIRLFKNAMNAISQLLEKEDTMLFSITFNWFDAEAKSITFSIEVYTNAEDERNLMLQWKKNPNIFILTNIVNLLKQSSFIIWAEINTKEINVDTRTITQWGVSRTVNYSTMDFTVPIQKNTEREIFDYIDTDSMKKLLLGRWFESNIEEDEETLEETAEEASEETSEETSEEATDEGENIQEENTEEKNPEDLNQTEEDNSEQVKHDLNNSNENL